jgi:hypothetical protein
MHRNLLFNNVPQFFFSPDAPIGGATSSGSPAPTGGRGLTGVPSVNAPTSKEDMIEFMGGDDEPTDVIDITDKTGKSDKSGKDKVKTEKELQTDDEDSDEDKDEEDDELAELEKELEGPTDEQLELVTPVRRKEILKKYPELFKDFPYLEKAYYREQQFTELLPTIDDAKSAVAKAQALDNFEADLGKGSTETVLKAVKEKNPKGFHKIVDDYLPTLARVDEQAYFHVLGNLTKQTIIAMVSEARKSNNEVLQSAASILNQFVFGTTDFKPPTALAKNTPEEAENTKVDEREQAFVRRQFEGVHGELNTKVNNTLRNTIDAHIDPKGSMNEYVKKNASKDALETLEGLISKDTRFKALTDKLWEKAFESNFSKESTDMIKSAFLSKAKTLLPAVIKKARNEALRGSSGRRVSDDDENSTPANRGPIAAGRPRSQTSSGKVNSGKDIPKGMSTLDFLNS